MKYYIYDFDDTIYDGDSGIDLVKFALKKYPIHTFKVVWYSLLYVLRLISKNKYKSKVFSFVKYIDKIDDFVNEFWNKHEKKLKKFWLEKKDHSYDIIISASGYFWLNYIKEKYEVGDLIATQYNTKTGEIIGNNCHGEEKVKLFYKKYPDGIIEESYSDSKNDLPLLKEAKRGYWVKKDAIYEFHNK